MNYYKLLRNCIYILTFQSIGQTSLEQINNDFTIAFGSCNKQNKAQSYWKSIMTYHPDVFLWGGDNIYGDTSDMNILKEAYRLQNSNPDYQKIKQIMSIMATWDDHDYGKNDVGASWKMKKQSQQLFLDFLDIAKEDDRRKKEGIYTSQLFTTALGSVKIVMLDTRYFRSPLLRDDDSNRRYKAYPNTNEEVTLLGEKQWLWLNEELKSNSADFTIIVSSIQFLSKEHGWETWGNFPNESKKLEDLIVRNNAKNVIILSGDRHISEFSVKKLNDLNYPLLDFTSSGLTHAFTKYDGEPNSYRKGKVISEPSFGILQFDFTKKIVVMKMVSPHNKVLQQHIQEYPMD